MRPEPPPPQPRQCGVVLTRDFHRDGDFIGWWEAVVPWIDGRHPGGLQTRAALPSRNNEAVEAGLLDHWTSWPALAERR